MIVTLKRGQDKQALKGYPWIFQNQLARVEGDAVSGAIARVQTSNGQQLGQGFYHTDSLIAVRMLTADPDQVIDSNFFRQRLESALTFREQAFAGQTHYRLAYSESDGLPGTIIDRYGDVLTWTTICFGMDQRSEMLLDILEDLVKPAAIVERNDAWLREKDGLTQQKGVLRGQYAGPVAINEHDLTFLVDVLDGPKTGFFMDQRWHRQRIGQLAKDRNVLDVFCADGGFGLQAAAGGASRVQLIDTSVQAIERATANAKANGLQDHVSFHTMDGLKALAEFAEDDKKFDLVILDPPAFAKSRRHRETAERAYQSININALRLLSEGGILATASCSQAVKERDFLKIVRYSARKAGHSLRMLYRGSQPPDHPILEAMPETGYLKFYIFQVV